MNLGESLDDLANLDPRGYGVCKLLYGAARKFTGEPLCVNGAKKLRETLKKGGLVYILTGFVLPRFEKAETDGAIGSVLLARTLVKAFDARPVAFCPEDCVPALEKLAEAAGLNPAKSVGEAASNPSSLGILPFEKDKLKAREQADEIIAEGLPKAVISVECPGENDAGIYRSAVGLDATRFQAKQDVLFEKLRDAGVLNIAVGDLGNEIGMGAIGEYIKKHIPYAHSEDSAGGTAARTASDNIITAAVSDWGCYALAAAIAYLVGDPDVTHGGELEALCARVASENGLIDMYGKAIPAIDGFGLDLLVPIAALMKALVVSVLRFESVCGPWFEKIAELNVFENKGGKYGIC